jgi:uncharacterized lipoprotein YajG
MKTIKGLLFIALSILMLFSCTEDDDIINNDQEIFKRITNPMNDSILIKNDSVHILENNEPCKKWECNKTD